MPFSPFVQGHLPPVLRTILEVIPLLSPADQLSPMWLVLLRNLLKYLPRTDSRVENQTDEAVQPGTSDNISGM